MLENSGGMKALILFLSLSLHKRQQAVLQNSSLCTGRRRRAMQCTIGGFFHKGNSDGKEGKEGKWRGKSSLRLFLRYSGEKQWAENTFANAAAESSPVSPPLFCVWRPTKIEFTRKARECRNRHSWNAVASRTKNDFSPFLCSQRPGLWAQH